MATIDIILPTYNRAHTLMRAVQSVQQQTFSAWQLFIIDDGSTDETRKLVAETLNSDPRIHYHRQEQKGVSAARNFGIQMSQAPWVAFLDSDDEWLSDKLSRQLKLLQDSKLLWGHGEEIWVRNGQRVNPMKKHFKAGGDQFARSLELCCISPSCAILHRTLLAETRGFREDFEVCEDYELWLRLSKKYEIAFDPQPIIKKYGGHEDQLSHKYHSMDIWRVRAQAHLLEEKGLSDSQESLVLSSMASKLRVLIKGAQKHHNESLLAECLEFKRKFF